MLKCFSFNAPESTRSFKGLKSILSEGLQHVTGVLVKYHHIVFTCCLLTHPLPFPLIPSDSICSLVVLHFQRSRVPGYSLFHPEEEVQPGQLPPRLPSLHHVHPLVDRHQVGPWGTMWVKACRSQTDRRCFRDCVESPAWYCDVDH